MILIVDIDRYSRDPRFVSARAAFHDGLITGDYWEQVQVPTSMRIHMCVCIYIYRHHYTPIYRDTETCTSGLATSKSYQKSQLIK